MKKSVFLAIFFLCSAGLLFSQSATSQQPASPAVKASDALQGNVTSQPKAHPRIQNADKIAAAQKTASQSQGSSCKTISFGMGAERPSQEESSDPHK